ncbi:MAG: hypothetical protein RL670_568 [Actinomycetota bacterium]
MTDALLNFLLPTNCAACGRAGKPLCDDCNEALGLRSRQVNRGRLEGFAACDYGQVAQQVIHSFKEGGQTCLATTMAGAMCALVSDFELEAVLLVGLPSSRQNYKRRGYSPGWVLASKLASRVRRNLARRKDGSLGHVAAANGLRFIRAVEDQSLLSAADRAQNLIGSMRASNWISGKSVILVDDVVTTGSTLAEAHRATSEAGANVLGFVTFAESLLKMSTQNQKWV